MVKVGTVSFEGKSATTELLDLRSGTAKRTPISTTACWYGVNRERIKYRCGLIGSTFPLAYDFAPP